MKVPRHAGEGISQGCYGAWNMTLRKREGSLVMAVGVTATVALTGRNTADSSDYGWINF